MAWFLEQCGFVDESVQDLDKLYGSLSFHPLFLFREFDESFLEFL